MNYLCNILAIFRTVGEFGGHPVDAQILVTDGYPKSDIHLTS